MKDIEIILEREADDDTWLYTATAKRGGLEAGGTGWSPETAIARARAGLIKLEKNLTPTTPNWENTVEAFLTRPSVAEIGFGW